MWAEWNDTLSDWNISVDWHMGFQSFFEIKSGCSLWIQLQLLELLEKPRVEMKLMLLVSVIDKLMTDSGEKYLLITPLTLFVLSGSSTCNNMTMIHWESNVSGRSVQLVHRQMITGGVKHIILMCCFCCYYLVIYSCSSTYYYHHHHLIVSCRMPDSPRNILQTNDRLLLLGIFWLLVLMIMIKWATVSKTRKNNAKRMPWLTGWLAEWVKERAGVAGRLIHFITPLICNSYALVTCY